MFLFLILSMIRISREYFVVVYWEVVGIFRCIWVKIERKSGRELELKKKFYGIRFDFFRNVYRMVVKDGACLVVSRFCVYLWKVKCVFEVWFLVILISGRGYFFSYVVGELGS